MACNESQTIIFFGTFTDSDSLVNKFCNIVSHKLKCDETQYNIQFLSCSCQLTKPEMQKITKKHKSSIQKKLIANRKNYAILRTMQTWNMLRKNLSERKLLQSTKVWML